MRAKSLPPAEQGLALELLPQGDSKIPPKIAAILCQTHPGSALAVVVDG